jgi:hypothetical protein
MATVRISQLTAITAPTDDDVLIINDADTNTRKITFANLTQNLVNTTSATQTKSGALTVSGTLTAGANFVVDTNTFFVDATTNRTGIRTISPNTELDVDGTVHIRNSNTLQFGDANDSNYVSLGAPSVIANNFALTLPASLPAGNNLLWSNGSGQLGYTTGITYDSGTQAMSVGQAYFTNQGSVRFYEQSVNGAEYVGFTAPANLAGTTGYTLPGTYPAANGFVLASTTGGVLSWVSNGAGAAGNAGDVQFSDGATLTSNSNFNFNNGSQTLQVPSISCGVYLEANGNVQLGNASGDDIAINGSVTTDFRPKVTNTSDLGSSILRWAEAHVTDLYSYGNVELGTNSSNAVSINGVVDTGIVPDADNTRSLGTNVLRWAAAWVHNINAAGDVILGDTAGDLLTVNADFAGRLIPRTDGVVDIGSSTKRFANVFTNQLTTYGTTTIGDTNADVLNVNSVIQSDLVPGVGTFDLGSAAAPWTEIRGTSIFGTSGSFSTITATTSADIANTSVDSANIAGIVSAAATNFDLGDIAAQSCHKVLVQARDVVTGDREFYEVFITTDGTVVSDVIGTNVQAPAGVFLTTPSTSLIAVGPATHVQLTLTNTATSGNAVNITITTTSVDTF